MTIPVGTLCIVIRGRECGCPQPASKIVEIVKPIHERRLFCMDCGFERVAFVYEVEDTHGQRWGCAAYRLRPIVPPGDPDAVPARTSAPGVAAEPAREATH